VDGGDVDLPTVFESSWIVGFFSKVFFTFIYLAIYAVRPLLVRPKAPSEWAHACRSVLAASSACLAANWHSGRPPAA
jgi:hypothetical protein